MAQQVEVFSFLVLLLAPSTFIKWVFNRSAGQNWHKRGNVYTKWITQSHWIERQIDHVWQCLKPLIFSFQRAETAQRETESLREQLSSTNLSQSGSPAEADTDTVTRLAAAPIYTRRRIDRLKISGPFSRSRRSAVQFIGTLWSLIWKVRFCSHSQCN